jgi:programmed cell death protein 4
MQVNAIVEEYFSSGDVGNAADSLSELEAPVTTMGHYFVKRLLTLALDRKDKEREMASSLLSNLYSEVRVVGERGIGHVLGDGFPAVRV